MFRKFLLTRLVAWHRNLPPPTAGYFERKTMKLKIILCFLLGTLSIQAQTNAPAITAQTNQIFVERLEIAGKIYTNSTVRALNPAQAIISTVGGGVMTSIADLPTNLQSQFNYNPMIASNFIQTRAQAGTSREKINGE